MERGRERQDGTAKGRGHLKETRGDLEGDSENDPKWDREGKSNGDPKGDPEVFHRGVPAGS